MATDDDRLSLLDGDDVRLPIILRAKSGNKRSPQARISSTEGRLISKRGRVHVYFEKVPEKSIRYVRDLWNTLVHIRWRWLMIIVCLVNLGAYLFVALFFLADAWISGDFNGEANHTTCVIGMNNFTSYFMLGIETITTTGYGYRYPTEYCKLVFILMTFSTLVTIFIDGAFISVVYVKMGMSTESRFEHIFSKKAVISLRNGKLWLVVRINDRLGKHHIKSEVNLYLVGLGPSNYNEDVPHYVHQLKLQPYGMLFLPSDILHEIDEESPLWNISARDLMTKRFEVILMVTGASIQTGQTSRSQTSYLNREIMWGHKFAVWVEYSNVKHQYIVNRKCFNKTISQDVPLCSAKVLTNLQNELKKRRNSLDLARSSDSEANQT